MIRLRTVLVAILALGVVYGLVVFSFTGEVKHQPTRQPTKTSQTSSSQPPMHIPMELDSSMELNIPGPVRHWQAYLIDCIYDPHFGTLSLVFSHPIASAHNYVPAWDQKRHDELRSAHIHSSPDQYKRTWANVKEKDAEKVVDGVLVQATANRAQLLVPCRSHVIGKNNRFYLHASTLICESHELKADEHDAVLDDDTLFQLTHRASSWISREFVRVPASSRSAGLFKHVARRKTAPDQRPQMDKTRLASDRSLLQPEKTCKSEGEKCFPFTSPPNPGTCQDCDVSECCAQACAILPDLVPAQSNFKHSKQTASNGECAEYCNSMKYRCVYWVRERQTGLCRLSIDEHPAKKLTTLVEADFSVASAGSTSGVNCQRGWCEEHPDMYLQGYPPSFDGDNIFVDLMHAKDVCTTLSDCGGITRDNTGIYSLRRGTSGVQASTAGDTSYVRDEDCWWDVKQVPQPTAVPYDWGQEKEQVWEDTGNSIAGIISVSFSVAYFIEEVAEIFRLQGFSHLYVLVGTHIAETYPYTNDPSWTYQADHDAHHERVVSAYRRRLSHLSSDFVSVVDVSGPFNRGEVRGVDHLREITNNIAAAHAWSFGATYLFRGDNDNTFIYDRDRYSSAVHVLDMNFHATCQARIEPRDVMSLDCDHAGSGWLGERYRIEGCFANYAVNIYKRTCQLFSLHLCQVCCLEGTSECVLGADVRKPPLQVAIPLEEGALQHWTSANSVRGFGSKCDVRPSLYTTQWLPHVQESLGKVGITPVAPNAEKEKKWHNCKS